MNDEWYLIKLNNTDRNFVLKYANKWIQQAELELSNKLNKNIKFKQRFFKHVNYTEIYWVLDFMDLYPDQSDWEFLSPIIDDVFTICTIEFPLLGSQYKNYYGIISTDPNEEGVFKNINGKKIKIFPGIFSKYLNEDEEKKQTITYFEMINNEKKSYYDWDSYLIEYKPLYPNLKLVSEFDLYSTYINKNINPINYLENCLKKLFNLFDSYIEIYKDFFIKKNNDIEKDKKIMDSLNRKLKIKIL